jgi:hypothetical protein
MRYREHRLPPPLDALIECVWFLTSESGDTDAGHTPASLRAAEGELSAYFTAPQRLAALFDGRRYG